MTDHSTGQMTARVMTFKKPHIEENVPQCDGLRTLKREGVQSAVVVPVRSGDDVLGFIMLGSRVPRKFRPDEIGLLDAIGTQMGVAVQKVRLHEETQWNLKRLLALHEIDLAITSSLDLHSVLAVLLEKIYLFLPYQAATTVRLVSPQGGRLEPITCRGLPPDEWKTQWSCEVDILRAVLENRAPLILLNVQKDPQVKDPSFAVKHKLVSFLGVPLIAKDEALGTLALYTREVHRFTHQEIQFFVMLAGQAAIAIHNSKLYESITNQSAELERSNKVKDEFLNVMSHELQTPMNVIMGYSKLIQDRILGEINTAQEEALHKVMSRSKDLLSLITNVLDATKIDTDTLQVENQTFSLHDFLVEVSAAYEAPSDKQLVLNWNYPADLPVIESDRGKVKRILEQLIDNAIKFTPQGSVTISVGFFPEKIAFQVKDTGIGIPKEAQTIIFEKFRQLDSSDTRAYEGAGLGLYIVKNLTRLLGGTVHVQSEPGNGSTFTLTIPSKSQLLLKESRHLRVVNL
jgi:signal transduction histidine kinase